jgi:excisionase family DNA binding protein
MAERTRWDPARLAFTPDEAAQSLGVSRSFFYTHILAEVRVVRIGRRRLVPVKEVERWLDRHAARVMDGL